ncbi:MAG: MucBP domain-containing protein [Clostridia bacterium]|nr:MucBP domain-containing protein [Clostridia bacterium]
MKKLISLIVAVMLLMAVMPASAKTVSVNDVQPAHVRLEGYAASDKTGSSYSEWVGFYDDDVTTLDHYDFMVSTYAGAYYDGAVYGYIYGYNTEGTLLTSFYKVNMKDHGVEFVEGASSDGVFVFAMAYNYADNKMYAMCDENNPYIATVDLATGALTPVVTIQLSGPTNLGMQCMTIDGSGNFYGLSFSATSSRLVSINISTGACTELLNTGLDTFYAQSMTYDRVNNRIYWAHADNSSSYKNGLYVIDMATMEMTHLGNIGDNGSDLEITALYIVEDYTAPAESHTLTINYVDENGTALDTPYVGTFEEGAEYEIVSPEIRDYTCRTPVVSGVMGSEDITVNVVYTLDVVPTHTLTVNYVDEQGAELAVSYTGSFEEGAEYSVESPVIAGYTCGTPVVNGVMGAEDVTVNVVYTADAPAVLIGDVNCDGVVTASDISSLFAYVMNAGSLSEQALLNADIDGNGTVDATDASLLAQMVFGA